MRIGRQERAEAEWAPSSLSASPAWLLAHFDVNSACLHSHPVFASHHKKRSLGDMTEHMTAPKELTGFQRAVVSFTSAIEWGNYIRRHHAFTGHFCSRGAEATMHNQEVAVPACPDCQAAAAWAILPLQPLNVEHLASPQVVGILQHVKEASHLIHAPGKPRFFH